jgi:hypothetical protein
MAQIQRYIITCECGAGTGVPGPGQNGHRDSHGKVIERAECIQCGAVLFTKNGQWRVFRSADKPQEEFDLLSVE